MEAKKVVMKQRYVIGIDISKSKIDCALLSMVLEVTEEKEVVNNDQKIKSYLNGVLKKLQIDGSELLVCCENTGIYNRPLERICVELGICLWVEHALKIKRASTDMRGKNDRQDALRIAEYAIRYQDKKVLYKEASEIVQELDSLVKARESLLGQKVALENQLRESKTHDPFEYKVLKSGYSTTLKTLENSIQKIEIRIKILVKKEDDIRENIDLITTIPGIGMQCAINMIISTNNFKSFSSAKHLACYSGVVPFQNQSGTIIKKDRISKMANKNLKRLLHLSAMAAIRSEGDLKEYYIRKVKEGKNKMSVLNAVRNKLVHRIMSVVTRKTPYLKQNDFLYQKKNEITCILT